MFKLLNPLLFCLLALGSAQSPLPFAARPGILGRPDLLPRPLPLPPTLAANARGVYQTPYVPIVDYSNEINVDGSYRYSFVTADGKQAEESGYLKNVSVNQDGDPVGVQVVQGSYSYTAPDGTPVQVTYIADENGFQPTSVRVPSDGRLPPASVAAAAAAGVLPRGSPYNSQYRQAYRNPYAVNPLLGRFSNPYVDPYAKPVAPVNAQ